MKFVTVAGALVYYRANYTFGRFQTQDVLIAILCTPFLLAVWVYPLYFFLSNGIGAIPSAGLAELNKPIIYFGLRLVNSVILVAVFEELLCRVYFLQYLFDAGNCRDTDISFSDRLFSPADKKPEPLQQLPLSYFSVIGVTLFFTFGHDLPSYLSAILYFSVTNFIYWKTRSLWICILIHSFTNLGVALLVRYRDMQWLWF